MDHVDRLLTECDWLTQALRERNRELKRLIRQNERGQVSLLLRQIDGNEPAPRRGVRRAVDWPARVGRTVRASLAGRRHNARGV